MKIVSNFNDYYDNIDNNTDDTYVRKPFVSGNGPNAIFIENLPPTSLWVRGSASNYKLFFLYFCDQVYPYIHDINAKKTYFTYDDVPEAFFRDCYIDTYAWNNVWGLVNKYHYRFSGENKYSNVPARRDKLKDLFSNFENKIWDFNTRIGYPILFARPGGYDIEKVINGSLKSIGFDKVLTSEETYARLYSWLNKHQNYNHLIYEQGSRQEKGGK